MTFHSWLLLARRLRNCRRRKAPTPREESVPAVQREWEDPRVFGLGKEAAHASFFGAETRDVALDVALAGSRVET